MAKPWIKSVRDAKQLTVYNGITAGKWANIFKPALLSFNKLRAGVKLVEAKDKTQANVVMQLACATCSFDYEGESHHAVLGNTLTHGKTLIFSRDGFVEKAAVFLPSEPDQKHVNVLKFIAVHELVHACGLTDAEHAGDGVFMTLPNIRNGQIWSSANSKKMPPMFLAPGTITKLKSIW